MCRRMDSSREAPTRVAGGAVWPWWLALALVLTLPASWSAAEQDGRTVERRLGGDSFAAGSTVSVTEPVSGDLFAAGGSVEVRAPVAGDAVLTGGKVWVDQDVGQSIFVAGGQVTVLGKVGRNLRTLGGEVMLDRKAEVAGNVSAAGGQLTLRGTVRGAVQAGGGRVLIDGPVGGDVVVGAGTLELGPEARIAGQLRWRSGSEIRQDPAAEVKGGIERIPLPAVVAGRPAREREEAYRGTRARAGFGLFWTAGLAVLAAALLAGLPRFYEAYAATLRERLGLSALLGFVLLVCVPFAVLFLMVTIIGIPLGLLAMLVYLALLPLAYVSAGIGFGDWGLKRWRPAHASALGWRIGAAALALLLLTVLSWVPWLGALLGFLVMLAGLGALLLQLHARWRGARQAA